MFWGSSRQNHSLLPGRRTPTGPNLQQRWTSQGVARASPLLPLHRAAIVRFSTKAQVQRRWPAASRGSWAIQQVRLDHGLLSVPGFYWMTVYSAAVCFFFFFSPPALFSLKIKEAPLHQRDKQARFMNLNKPASPPQPAPARSMWTRGALIVAAPEQENRKSCLHAAIRPRRCRERREKGTLKARQHRGGICTSLLKKLVGFHQLRPRWSDRQGGLWWWVEKEKWPAVCVRVWLWMLKGALITLWLMSLKCRDAKSWWCAYGDLETVSNNYLLTRKDTRGWSLLYQGDESTKPQAGTDSGGVRRWISRTVLKRSRWWFVTRKTTSTKQVKNKRMNLHVFPAHGLRQHSINKIRSRPWRRTLNPPRAHVAAFTNATRANGSISAECKRQ